MAEVSFVDRSLPAPPAKASGSALLTLGGLAAAFGVAACCALPLLLISLGLSTAWLGEVASVAAPNRAPLLAFAALALAGGAILLWRQQRHAANCGPNGVCAPLAVRVLTLVGLIVGVLLLIAGYLYA
ncbi:MAG: mercuric reductase [Sphingomonas sp.]|uniref:mercuric transporter MerT family protein n=1 Tax=Sphingomonas sp. TaxID=28214 RepID=UPI00185BDF26|nr:mercuric transporter MerT family protein [Sphingomonas sp.]MBA3667424.1 mercuric reductase [Sphingomonas sp.]